MATPDEDLSQLERDVRQLKIEYEQYFGGGRNRPPSDTEWRIELILRRYADRGGELNYAQRFRYNNLAQTFAKYTEVFRKRLKQKEEGTVHKSYGTAAKALEAERSKSRPAAAAAGPAHPASHAGEYSAAWSDPDRETDKVQQLYQALVDAKQKAGEKTDTLTLDSFKKFVSSKTQQLKQKESGEVEFSVSVEAGQVKLKARVKGQ